MSTGEIRQAVVFLAWLRRRRRDLDNYRQADVDAWYAGGYTARRLTHAFLRWAIRNQLLAAVTIPHQATTNPAPISQQQRLATIRRAFTDDEVPLLTRVVAILMLLYAQPLTRILQLTVDDVLVEDGEVSIRLGDLPSPVPQPFAGLLLDRRARAARPASTGTRRRQDARLLHRPHSPAGRRNRRNLGPLRRR